MLCIVENKEEEKYFFKLLEEESLIAFDVYKCVESTFYIGIFLQSSNSFFIFKFNNINNIYIFIKNINLIYNNIILYFNILYLKNNINKLNLKYLKKINNLLLELENYINISSLYYSNFNKKLSNNILSSYYNIELLKSSSKIKNYILTRINKNSKIPISLIFDYLYDKIKSLLYIYSELESHNLLETPQYSAYLYRSKAFFDLYLNGLSINTQFLSEIISNPNSYNTSLVRISKKIYKQIYNSTILNNDNKLHNFIYSIDSSPTGRASSKNNSINLLALNKGDGSRNLITTRFNGGSLFLFDYNGMHIRIIGHLIDFNIPYDVSAHEYVLKDIEGIDTLTHEDIKKIMFEILYSKDDIDIDSIFIKKMRDFKKNKLKMAVTPLNRKYLYNIVDENKGFNYFIQQFEVDYLVVCMNKLNSFLNNKKSKLCLYQYDGVLIDIDKTEMHLIPQIQKILEYGVFSKTTFPVNIFKGKTFDKMEKYYETKV